MTNCPVCQRETNPIKIGAQSYCSICGSVLRTESAAPATTSVAPAPAHRRSMDVAGRPAAALHGRTQTSRVLDLRHANPKPLPAAPTTPTTPTAHRPIPAHGVPAAPPHSTAHERHLAHLDARLAQARQVERSAHIQKFGASIRLPAAMVPVAAPAAPEPRPVIIPAELPRHVITQHEAMTKLTQLPAAAAPAPKPQRPRRTPHFTPSHGRAFATAAAITLMGSYIWLSNYPKLALQNASNQAGLAASLPGYLPSSYSLNSTNTSPGLVTLNFSSPSASEKLKIAQRRTNWDSSSLLDNFVAKAADDYSTVQSQGLTIYLFSNNQASWVNHGIWYSIDGASRLSREQILKIAYSL
ncbi:MAG: hypothetical protein NVSMB39_7840 [Candidatus Saccharimonadales bacterium]